ncbi:traA_3 (plasmid) [Escherichia coli]|nr:traA_3 [Escherichia coli]
MKATFGADSFVIMCIYIAEIVIGVATYIRTKNLLILLGLVVVIVFTTVGLTFVN